jgi:hypothetical protein
MLRLLSDISKAYSSRGTEWRVVSLIRRIVFQRAIGGALEIPELAGAERREEGCEAEAAKEQRRGDEPGKSGHDFAEPASRAA